MAYRKFWLINALGNRYDFTDSTKSPSFLNNPLGLGFRRSYTSLVVGNSELITSQQFMLTDIQGDLLFYDGTTGNKYQQYQDFIQFAKFKPLELHYQTPNDLKSYYCDVLFIQADKTEVKSNGVLTVPVMFHRLTEWLNDEDYSIILVNDSTDNGKYYNLIRNYHYAGTTLQNTPINNNGTDDVGFIIEVNGECQNLQFTLTQRGEQYGICKINGTYDYIMIDSVERTESMYLERNGSAITNPEQYPDFTIRNGASYLTWCKFRVGETILNITMGNIDTFDGNIVIRFKNSYVSV
jgi:hypothetical protein